MFYSNVIVSLTYRNKQIEIMKTVSTIVMIGKSRKEIAYTFKADDFIRIEGNRLFLKSDDRRIVIANDFVKQTIICLNEL